MVFFKILLLEGTVNSKEQKTRVLCKIDVQEFHLWIPLPPKPSTSAAPAVSRFQRPIPLSMAQSNVPPPAVDRFKSGNPFCGGGARGGFSWNLLWRNGEPYFSLLKTLQAEALQTKERHWYIK
jgi:hypothetical protein